MRVDAPPRPKRKPVKRRVTKRGAPPAGKETHQIIDPEGKILRDSTYGEGATLALAQGLAQKYAAEVTLIVRVKTLFGEPDNLYRVVREEDGSITTWRT